MLNADEKLLTATMPFNVQFANNRVELLQSYLNLELFALE